MRNNITNLSVHKNNKAQKERKKIRKDMMLDTKDCSQLRNIKGYVVMAYGDDRNVCHWYCQDGTVNTLPERVRALIQGNIHRGEIIDDS